jgi:hypothetical protein
MTAMSTDKFQLGCPGCGKTIAVSRAHVGKKGRCPACQTTFPIVEPVAADELQPLGPIDGGLQPLGAGSDAWAAPPARPQPVAAGSPFGAPYAPPAQPGFGQPSPGYGNQPAFPNGGFGGGDEGELRMAPLETAPPSSFGGAPFMNSPSNEALGKAYVPPQPQSGSGEGIGTLLAGIGMMVGAVVWFVGGLMFDIIFFYPPILFILGLVACVKGGLAALSSR